MSAVDPAVGERCRGRHRVLFLGTACRAPSASNYGEEAHYTLCRPAGVGLTVPFKGLVILEAPVEAASV